MIERFEGLQGQAARMNMLRAQFLIDGNTDLAKIIAAATVVKDYLPGAALFSEGDRGGELFFILEGQVSIRKRGRELTQCGAGIHVGEIGLLEPFKGRSASVIAIDTVVVAQITLQKFIDIAETHPNLWRRMALELAHRLVQLQDAV